MNSFFARQKQYFYTILRKTEKYTKTDMVYLAKGGFWLTFGQGMYAVMAFFLSIAFAHFLSPNEYGTYKFTLALFGILNISTISGIGQAFVQAVARGFEGGINKALYFKIRWGLLGVGGGIALSLYYFLQGNLVLFYSFLVLAFFVPFLDTLTFYTALWNGRKRYDVSTLCASATNILSSLSLIATLFFTRNIVILLFVYCTSLFLLRLFFHIITVRYYPPNTNEDPAVIKSGVHFSIMNIFPLIAQQIDKILLFHYLGAAQVAIYSFAVAIPEQIKSLLKGLQTIIIPKFAQKETDEIKRSISAKMLPLLAVLASFSLLYFLFAKYIYIIFFPAYIESIAYSQIYAISIIALAFILPHSLFQAKLATRELYQFNIARSVTQIVFIFIGAYTAGIWGVIIARVLGEFLGFLILIFLSRAYREKASSESLE